jgi:hypothetical protein
MHLHVLPHNLLNGFKLSLDQKFYAVKIQGGMELLSNNNICCSSLNFWLMPAALDNFTVTPAAIPPTYIKKTRNQTLWLLVHK